MPHPRRLVLTAFAAVWLAGCSLMSPPAQLDQRLAKPSAAALYQVTLYPPQPAAAINEIHAWEVEVRTPAGAPVADASIGVSGGMPQHFHGFPTRPQVTENLGNGRYVIDGVKFSMTGWWQMKLKIDSVQGSDLVEFNTVVQNRPKTPAQAGLQ